MNIEQKDNNLLINEWQLGQQLNTAVVTGARDKFNLLLSFLSDDARDFAQFSLPQQDGIGEASKQSDLRAHFSLGDAQPLVNKGMSLEQAQFLNQNAQKDNLCSIRLQLQLSNDPILSRSEDLPIASEVSDNLSFLTQHRLAKSLQAAKPQETASVNEPAAGVNHQLMEEYQALDFVNKPIKVTYM